MNPNALIVAAVPILFLALLALIFAPENAECDGPTDEQIMQMIPLWCGKDGCQ